MSRSCVSAQAIWVLRRPALRGGAAATPNVPHGIPLDISGRDRVSPRPATVRGTSAATMEPAMTDARGSCPERLISSKRRRIIAILAASAFVISCSPAPTPTTRISATPAPTASENAAPAQVEPPVVDRAHVVPRLEWSPDHSTLAVTTAGVSSGQGRVDLLSADGAQRASLTAEAAAWVDASHLVTLETTPADPDGAAMAAWLVDVQTGSRLAIEGRFSGLLGGSHGAVALTRTPTQADSDAMAVIWRDGALDPAPFGGSPVAWSPDGSLLAFATAPRVPLGASAGGSEPARLVIVGVPSWERRFDSGDDLVDARLPVYFSADGRSVAATSTSGGTLIFDLATTTPTRVEASSPFGWTSNGGLILVGEDGQIRLRDGDGVLTDPALPTGLPVYGPAGSIAVLQPAATITSGSVQIGRNGTWRTVSGVAAGRGTPIAWTADGSACFLATGSSDASRELDRVFRVTVP